jgi:hypothetical protein
MPFRRRKTEPGSAATTGGGAGGAGGSRDVPLFLFKIIHLRNPLANGPVRYGDPVWLQVTQGRGDDGWRSGSVLAPYVHLAVGLDATGVDIEGKPAPPPVATATPQPLPPCCTSLRQARVGLAGTGGTARPRRTPPSACPTAASAPP